MSDFNIKAFDTRPALSVTLQDGDGDAVDLNGASVVFSMGTGGSRVSEKAVSIISPSEGRVQYEWSAADTWIPGNYQAEFEVTYSGGEIETFPRSGYIDVRITERNLPVSGTCDFAPFFDSAVLTDTSATFVSDGFEAGDIVFIDNRALVADIVAETTITFLLTGTAFLTDEPYVIRKS